MAMTECHRNVLRKARVYLMENMEINTIMEHLISELVITASDEDALNTEKTNRTKTKALLETLPRKGDNGYMKLMKALREKQAFVYDYLHEMEQEIDQQLRAPSAPTSQVQQLIAQPQSSPCPSRRSYCPTDEASMESNPGSLWRSPFQTQSCHPTDQPSMSLQARDCTDSGLDRSQATCTGSTSYQISSPFDKGNVIDSDTLPCSPRTIVSQKALSILANKIGSEWEQLAIHMGFKQNKLFHWKQENQTVWGQVFALLTSWSCENGNNATISQLLAVLLTFQPPLDPSVYRHLYFE